MILGIIGCGNMGGALANGILSDKALGAEFPLRVYNRSPRVLEPLGKAGATIMASPSELVKEADIILLAVKPYQIADLLREITPALAGKLVLSVAAGVTIGRMQEACGRACPVARVMPNTLVAVGEGLFGVCFDDETIAQPQKDAVCRLFAGLGTVIELPEGKMNAFSALAGCGPAYVYYLADALIEAGVTVGLTRGASTDIALSLLKGSVELARKSGKHPVVLREQVTSPGGMTIAGTNLLDRKGVRGALIDAVLAADARGKAMESE